MTKLQFPVENQRKPRGLFLAFLSLHNPVDPKQVLDTI